MSAHPEVLIVGRPNVGKSTLFNRFVGKSVALVDDRPGSTRDLREAEVTWLGHTFHAIDSGGWIPGEVDNIASQIAKALEEKVETAALLLWITDGGEGITAADEILGRHLRKFNVPIILAVNKADRYDKFEHYAADFQKLGFDVCLPISASHGIGIDDLLDAMIAKLETSPGGVVPDAKEGVRPIRLALLGKPNVGKSSLVNALLGQKRLLVDATPGTTHDAIAIGMEYEGHPITLIDTAGLRSNKKQDSRIEELSIQQTLNALQTCQGVLFLVDGETGITHQDVTIGKMIEEAFRPVVILINKWDIHPKAMEQSWAEKITKRHLRALSYAPVVIISAKTGLNLERIFPTILDVWQESNRVISTGQLNNVLHAAMSKQAPAAKKGYSLKMLYGYQRKGHPPAIEIVANHPESTRLSYVRYLEEEIRQAFDMKKTPLQVVMKLKKSAHPVNKKKSFKPSHSGTRKVKR